MDARIDAASIVAHLGGEDFLAGLGARNFVVDDAHLSFTLVHDNPKHVHSVTISKEPHGHFKVTCYGRINRGSLQIPIVGTASVTLLENLAGSIGELTGIEALLHRHF